MINTHNFSSIRGPHPMRGLGWRGNNYRFLRDRIKYISMLYEKYGEIATFSTDNPERWLFAFGPQYNKKILTNTDIFQHINPIKLNKDSAAYRLTQGLLMHNGNLHKNHRAIMMPMFQRSSLVHYIDYMCHFVSTYAENLQEHEPRDIDDDMRVMALNIACHTIFDLEIELGMVDAFREWLTRFTSPFVSLFSFDIPLSPLRQFYDLSDRIESYIKKHIQVSRRHPERRDMLSRLCQVDGLSDEEIVGEAMTLLVAGHETTATALGWIIFLLSQHPIILNALTDELLGCLRGGSPTADTLEQLPLLDRVIRESLRLFTPIPYQHRQATDPFELGDYILPAGSIVSYSPYITHRMPHLYSNPETFTPDRWLRHQPSTYEYLPFGAGPRMCIGAAFAGLELKVVLSIVLQRWHFKLQPGSPIERSRGVILASRYGLPMTIQRPHMVQRTPLNQRRGNVWDMFEMND